MWETSSLDSVGKHSCLTANTYKSCLGSRSNPSEDEKTSHHMQRERSGSATKPWTLTHGFYAQMGGFVLDTTGAFPNVLPPDRSVLTFDSFRYLLEVSQQARSSSPVSHDYYTTASSSVASSNNAAAGDGAEQPSPSNTRESISVSVDQEDLASSSETQNSDSVSHLEGGSGDKIDLSFMNISEQDIQDKSKADGLAKTLVCVQALWFCAQCISRVTQQLPITLLELNTFAHSICALLVYLLWWQKPLAIERATSVSIYNSIWIQTWAKLRYHCFIPHDWRPSWGKHDIYDPSFHLKLEPSVASYPVSPYDEIELPR